MRQMKIAFSIFMYFQWKIHLLKITDTVKPILNATTSSENFVTPLKNHARHNWDMYTFIKGHCDAMRRFDRLYDILYSKYTLWRQLVRFYFSQFQYIFVILLCFCVRDSFCISCQFFRKYSLNNSGTFLVKRTLWSYFLE